MFNVKPEVKVLNVYFFGIITYGVFCIACQVSGRGLIFVL